MYQRKTIYCMKIACAEPSITIRHCALEQAEDLTQNSVESVCDCLSKFVSMDCGNMPSEGRIFPEIYDFLGIIRIR